MRKLFFQLLVPILHLVRLLATKRTRASIEDPMELKRPDLIAALKRKSIKSTFPARRRGQDIVEASLGSLRGILVEPFLVVRADGAEHVDLHSLGLLGEPGTVVGVPIDREIGELHNLVNQLSWCWAFDLLMFFCLLLCKARQITKETVRKCVDVEARWRAREIGKTNNLRGSSDASELAKGEARSKCQSSLSIWVLIANMHILHSQDEIFNRSCCDPILERG